MVWALPSGPGPPPQLPAFVSSWIGISSVLALPTSYRPKKLARPVKDDSDSKKRRPGVAGAAADRRVPRGGIKLGPGGICQWGIMVLGDISKLESAFNYLMPVII